MKIKLEIDGRSFHADLSLPIDISIPLSPRGPRAWYVDPMEINPVLNDRFTGSVSMGGDVNFRNVSFNPHGHGTHTESIGHIDRKVTSVNQVLKKYFYTALLISLEPEAYEGAPQAYREAGDLIVTKENLAMAIGNEMAEALVLRTLPNGPSKLSRVYSGTNPPYLEPEAMDLIREKGYSHILLDLPSVDREVDGGKLNAHHHFWEGGRNGDEEGTITEFIYVPDEINDGLYLLEIQTAPLENDATPSRPVLYKLSTD